MSGPELAAAGGVRQRGADRRDRRGDALRDDRRADHRRHDEQVIAHADAAVGPPVARETPVAARRRSRHAVPRIVGRLGEPRLVDRGLRVAADRRGRACSRRCACGRGRPAGMSAVATPMGLPYFTTARPRQSARIATLWPRGIGSRTTTARRPPSTVAPGVERLERGRDVVALADHDGPAFTGSLRSPGTRRRRRSAGR